MVEMREKEKLGFLAKVHLLPAVPSWEGSVLQGVLGNKWEDRQVLPTFGSQVCRNVWGPFRLSQ